MSGSCWHYLQSILESLTRRWWWKVIAVVLLFMPPYAELPAPPQQTPELIASVLRAPLAYYSPLAYGGAKVLFAVLALGLAVAKECYATIFSYYVGLLFLAIAVFQTTAVTPSYGFVYIAGNSLLSLAVGMAWLVQGRSSERLDRRTLVGPHAPWLAGLALLAFWFPVDATGHYPSFTMVKLLLGESVVTLCMLLPVASVIVLLLSDRANRATLSVTGFVGLLFGLLNLVTWFVINRGMWWMGILHMPLLVISVFLLRSTRQNNAFIVR